jgi:hypothetical protein
MTSDLRRWSGAQLPAAGSEGQRRSLPWETPVGVDTQVRQAASLQQIRCGSTAS